MSVIQVRDNVKDFVKSWSGRGSEKADARSFWIELIHALGVDQPTKILNFEVPVDVDDHKCYIDVWIKPTKILVEHKSRGIDLDKPAQQSDKTLLTPFEQARRYAEALDYSERPKWIVVSNFDVLVVYNMNEYSRAIDDEYQPNVIAVDHLAHDYFRLNFLIDPDDENVNPAIKVSKLAIERIEEIYKYLKASCNGIDLDTLNKFCVRLMFCFYADDSGIFDPKQFRDYFNGVAPADCRSALVDLFRVLDMPIDKRDPDLRAELAAFPYVNGDLFKGAAEQVPPIDAAVRLGIVKAADFDWIDISPPIFGAMFESISHERRTGGMHYTSIDNIHRVIDPLFMDELHQEFNAVKRRRKNRLQELERLQLKLAALKFFDPACGSGNFLTETYISIRNLENEIIDALRRMGEPCEILVSIENFYGIEVNDFAVAIARTALWIAENQMMNRTSKILNRTLNFLPLTSAAHIKHGNALTLDWNEIAERGIDYVIGNPPFVGHQWRTDEQVADMVIAFHDLEKHGKLDYVCAWYNKAVDFMKDNETRAAFVSTNSICQGESVGILWRHPHIDFARQTFKWTSDSEDMAAVHCVIVGLSDAPNDRPRLIFDGEREIVATNINGYLLDAPNVFIQNRGKPLYDWLPKMTKGSQPTDGGHLLLTVEERDQLLKREPRAEKFIRRFIGAEEFINGKERYCLWLVHATEDDLRLPAIAERLDAVRLSRLKSKTAAVRTAAATPHLFTQLRQPTTDYIVVPRVSSERRKYIPMGFMPPTIIVSDANLMLSDATLFHFGVLESSVHAAWLRVVCGRLGTSYRYTQSVYNNFVWCDRSSSIEETAQQILAARALYPSRTLASLYDPDLMPLELRTAHDANDRAVLSAYGFDESMSESEIVARLMELYSSLTGSRS